VEIAEVKEMEKDKGLLDVEEEIVED